MLFVYIILYVIMMSARCDEAALPLPRNCIICVYMTSYCIIIDHSNINIDNSNINSNSNNNNCKQNK